MRYWFPCLTCSRAVVDNMPRACYNCRTGRKPKMEKIPETENPIYLNRYFWLKRRSSKGGITYKSEESDSL